MKKIFLVSVLCVFVAKAFAQNETFDIVTYTPPKGWKKDVTGDITSYSITNKTKNNWCQLGIVKSTNSKGSIEQDFESEWQELIVKNYKPTSAPQLDEVKEADGWKIKSGATTFTFNNGEAIAMLTTISGFDRCVSVVATTNSEDYLNDIESFLSSVDLKKSETNGQLPANNTNSPVGTWGISTIISSPSNFRKTEGTIITQYTFNANGTYSFYIKTFRYQLANLLLTRETGVYQINENSITVTPQRSVIESWSKKNGTDDFGELLSSQKKELEKTTYRFSTKNLISGPVLVLQVAQVTKRDGPFNNSDKDAWLYPSMSSNEFIKLPGGKQMADENIRKEPVTQTAHRPITLPSHGIWSKTSSARVASGDPAGEGTGGYTKDQYTFNTNGTYSFVSKTFRMNMNKIILVKENGTYIISGATLTIDPKNSLTQSWSKSGGVDKWGSLLSTQNRTLEKASYTFTKHFFSGIGIWNLVLQSNKPTARDGAFSNNTTFNNAWYFAPITSNNPVIELPGSEQ